MMHYPIQLRTSSCGSLNTPKLANIYAQIILENVHYEKRLSCDSDLTLHNMHRGSTFMFHFLIMSFVESLFVKHSKRMNARTLLLNQTTEGTFWPATLTAEKVGRIENSLTLLGIQENVSSKTSKGGGGLCSIISWMALFLCLANSIHH